MVPDERLQQIIENKDSERALEWVKQHRYIESWTIMDGCLVIYDVDDHPDWLKAVLENRDDDGNTPEFAASQSAKE